MKDLRRDLNVERPDRQHPAQGRQPTQEHEPNQTKGQNSQSGAEARNECRRIRVDLPADLSFCSSLEFTLNYHARRLTPCSERCSRNAFTPIVPLHRHAMTGARRRLSRVPGDGGLPPIKRVSGLGYRFAPAAACPAGNLSQRNRLRALRTISPASPRAPAWSRHPGR